MLIANNELPKLSFEPQGSALRVATLRLASSLTSKSLAFGEVTEQGLLIERDEEGDFIEITQSPGNITQIKVNGQSLRPRNEGGGVANGTYFVKRLNNNFRIYLNVGYEAVGLSAVVFSVVGGARTTKVAIPEVLSYPTITGQLSISQTFKGHPSGSFTLVGSWGQIEQIASQFEVGKEVVLYGIGFRVSRLGITRTLSRFSRVAVNVSLQGKWEAQGDTLRNSLDQPIQVKRLASPGNSYSYARAAGAVGVRVQASDPLWVKTDKSLNEDETITLRELIESDRLLKIRAYPRWESPSFPILQDWNTYAVWVVEPSIADLSQSGFPDIELGSQGFGAKYSKCKLAHELSRAKLEVKEVETPQKKRRRTKQCFVTGDLHPREPFRTWKGSYYYAFDYNNLKSLSWCFDIGNRVKKEVTRCQIDGQDIEVTEKTWGFVFTSADVYEYQWMQGGSEVRYSFQNPEAADWTQVREIVYKYKYNAKTGYYEGKIGTGWELRRVLQETEDQKEAITLAAAIEVEFIEEAKTQLQNELNGYRQFFKVPINDSETFELDDLSIPYKDLRPKEGEGEEQETSLYVIPLYPHVKIDSTNSFHEASDPRQTPGVRQPSIITGERATNQVTQLINSTDPEVYLTFDVNQNAQGQNFQDSSNSETYTQNAGRPGLQNRIDTTRINEDDSNGEVENESDRTLNRIYVSTPGAIIVNRNPQSLSYTDADTFREALAAATTDYQIQNSQDSCTLSLPLGDFYPNIRPGDCILFEGQLYRVFGITIGIEIGAISNLKEMRLDCGKYMDHQLIVSNQTTLGSTT